ncbi:serine/threonine-protein kinase [Stieleria varia]|uniref:Serine/threonine-protein kinase PrkC n=1 Tax=Stieleria varia TaxID=2528005 RepID=A0A5C6B150_9BACT|nr:AAA family ATPase [Stieleria varia]TWU05527.1 Serine/threonine-protein kinase PrkC [Stieleria varia]
MASHEDDLPLFNPNNDTQVRPVRQDETFVLNSTQRGVPPPWQEGDRYGDFEVQELLGWGNSGFVYRAYDHVARHRCALKVLGPLSSRELCRNKLGFRRMTPFRHPNLMQVDRIHVLDDKTVFAMQHVNGTTLSDAIPLIRAMPEDQAFAIVENLVRDYATGLATIHLAGLVHRDIKPSNLMVTPDHRGVIIDFGLVATCNPEVEADGVRSYLAGTPRYFSPEAVWEQLYTPPGDLFGLGLVTLEIINAVRGRNDWFRMGEFQDWRRDQDKIEIEQAVDGLKDGVPAWLRKVCRGMLRVNRAKRFTAIQVALQDRKEPLNIPWITKQPLFGRTQEVAEARQWIRSILDGKSERLHIHGPSGIGKSRLIDEIEAILEAMPWCQVFRVRCRTREQHSLQVLDQIADQIASRYSRGDREKLRVDPVSASILHEMFPQLRHVVVSDMSDNASPLPDAPERIDALRAAMRLSVELRKVGPLFIIVDDAQWSDHDTNTVWDELQQDGHGRLGIITVSRDPETYQRQPADHKIHLRALSVQRSAELLGHAAKQWGVKIKSATCRELAELTGGNPFRLQELAEEFRPGGELHDPQPALDSSLTSLRNLDRLWQRRFNLLSVEARSVLPYVVTASRPVSTQQLEMLTDLGLAVDAAVSELVKQRLVNDDATGGECITIVHDKVADGLFQSLTDEEQRDAHKAWANLLISSEHPTRYAARIANHLRACGESVAALPFAINAAIEADRIYAKVEAGEWHAKILEMVSGEARQKHLRDAARCFYEGDVPLRAAEYFRQLADESDDLTERIRFTISATEVLIRCGKFVAAKPHLDLLLQQLNLRLHAEPASTSIASLRDLVSLASSFIQRPLSPFAEDRLPGNLIVQHQLELCSYVARPIAMFDLRSTVNLLTDGSRLAQKYGTIAQQAYFASSIAICVLLAGNRPAQRQRTHGMLQTLRDQVRGGEDKRAIAEIETAQAYVEALEMRWDAVIEPMSIAIRLFTHSDLPSRFETSQMRWLGFWADWNLGNWSHIVTVAEEMLHDSQRRRDPLQHLLATGGFGGNAALIENNAPALKQFQRHHRHVATCSEQVEMVDFLVWVSRVQRLIYEQKYQQAWFACQVFNDRLQSSLINRLHAIRTTVDFYIGLSAAHMQRHSGLFPVIDESRVAAKCWSLPQETIGTAIKNLKSRHSPYAKMLAALLSGISLRHDGRFDQALIAFGRANTLATQLSLAPFIAATSDAMEHLETGTWSEKLRHQMIHDNVVSPIDLERLYVVAPPESEISTC